MEYTFRNGDKLRINYDGTIRIDEEHWVTTTKENSPDGKGHHFLVDENGNIVKGLGGWRPSKTFENIAKELEKQYLPRESKEIKISSREDLIKALSSLPDGMAVCWDAKYYDRGMDGYVVYTYSDGDRVITPYGSYLFNEPRAMYLDSAGKYWDDFNKNFKIVDADNMRNIREQLQKKLKETTEYKNAGYEYQKHEGKINDETPEKYGQPGTYIVYRSGKVNNSGMCFFATTVGQAETYSSLPNADGTKRGNTNEYEIEIKNPLIIQGETESHCVGLAYKELQGKPLGEITPKKWQMADKRNASALKKKGYDAIIYMINGKATEVQIPSKEVLKRGKKTAEYTKGISQENKFASKYDIVLPKKRERIETK